MLLRDILCRFRCSLAIKYWEICRIRNELFMLFFPDNHIVLRGLLDQSITGERKWNAMNIWKMMSERWMFHEFKYWHVKICWGNFHLTYFYPAIQMLFFALAKSLNDFPFWNQKKREETVKCLAALMMTIKVYGLSIFCLVIY